MVLRGSFCGRDFSELAGGSYSWDCAGEWCGRGDSGIVLYKGSICGDFSGAGDPENL